MLKRSLYRIHAAVYRIDGWFKQRFTSPGMLLVGLLVLVILAPLPLGSYRSWSWSLAALIAAILAIAWVLSRLPRRRSLRVVVWMFDSFWTRRLSVWTRWRLFGFRSRHPAARRYRDPETARRDRELPEG